MANEDNVEMRKVIIIGNAGSGKTTFAKKLHQKTKLPLVHLDKVYWIGEWEHISREEFDAELQKELEKEQWIIDGNYDRTISHRLKYCDTVFYFELPRIVCLWGSTQRVFKNYGKCRDDMGGNCIERFDKRKFDLYKMILSFGKSKRLKYRQLLKSFPDKNIVIFKSRRQANAYIEKI